MSRIAVVGTGISGLGVASLLHKHHDITVYEKDPQIGGHSRTKSIVYGQKPIAVDTGFIVFNYRNYPLLSGLFRSLGVAVQKSNMTFGVTSAHDDLEWGAQNANALFGQRRNLFRPKFYRLLIDVMRFNATAYSTVKRHPHLTLGELLTKMRLSEWFAQYYILPMGGAIWSCPLATMLAFPAMEFIQFFKDHGLLTVTQQPQWYTVCGGSQEYTRRLAAPFMDRILTSSPVLRVSRRNNAVLVTTAAGTETFDKVIFACHADQALTMLEDASNDEKSALGAFTYQTNHAVLHKDTSVMPVRRRCWSSWVYHASSQPADRLSVTYWMNLLQSIDDNCPLFVTLNPLKPIASEHILDEHVFEHPVFTREAVAAQKHITVLQGLQNTWYCGAHLRNGFHEDGLASAVSVAKRLGVDVPWE